MTLVEDRPVAERAPVRPSRIVAEPAAWRFAARLARRETRRRPGRTVLASLLIAVPVAAMTIGSLLARTESNDWAAQFERRYGDADIAVDRSWFASTSDASATAVDLPAGTVTTEHLWLPTTISSIGSDSSFAYGTLTDLDLAGAGGEAPVEVIAGQAPTVGEILLPEAMADELGVSIGDQVTFERPSGTWTVSGYGRIRDSYYNNAIVIPGFDTARIAPGFEQSITLYELPAATSSAETQRLAARLDGLTPSVDPFGSGPDLARGMAWGWVAGVLALVGVGIIVAAAFATSARRQLVTIGQLTANGATHATVRRTLALQGTWTGVVGAVVGIAAGFAALPVAKPLFEQFILLHDMSSIGVNVVDLIVIAMTATVAATVAAAVPARSVAQIPVMSALAGRRPLGTLPRWLVPTGLLLLAGGLGLVAVAALGANGAQGTGSNDVWALLVVLGVLGVVFGMCCATPLVIEWIGRLGRGMSLSWRLALRSLARSRTRSAAVVAAIAVVVGGSVAAGAMLETSLRERVNDWVPTLPADTVLLGAWQYQPEVMVEATDGSGRFLDLDPLDDAPVPDELLRRIEAIVPGATFVPMRVATIDPPPYDTDRSEGSWPDPNGPVIADAATIATIGLSDADVETLQSTGSLQPISRWEARQREQVGDGIVTYQYRGPDGLIEIDATRGTTATEYEYATSLYVTEAFARQKGFDIVERGAIVRASAALTVAQRDRLNDLRIDLDGQQFDAFVEPGDPPRAEFIGDPVISDQWSVNYDEPRYRTDLSDLWIARLVILGAVMAISLLVVAIGLSLAAAEGRDERNVLAVVGATPASMRRQSAARGVVMAMSGIALGIPTGFLPAWVLYSVLSSTNAILVEPLRFPWLIAAALIVAVPLAVAAVAWAGSLLGQRFRPPTPTRRD